jgi:hypothetical protein
MDETGADFAVGRIRPRWESEPPPWLSPRLFGVLAVPENGPSRFEIRRGFNEHAMPIGANMAVRAGVVASIGGWRADLGKLRHTLRSGEDHEFYLRMLGAGLRGVYEPLASVAHLVPADRMRRSYFMRWLYDNGRVVATIERQYPSASRYLLGVPRYRWRDAACEVLSLLRPFPARTPSRFANLTRVLWFVGYLQQTMGGRSAERKASTGTRAGRRGAGAWQAP